MGHTLPSGWAECAVADIGQLIRGITYKKEQSAKAPGPSLIPILRANNINDALSYDDLVYVPRTLVDHEQLLREGDIVFAMSSGSVDLVGKSARAAADLEGSCGAFCAILRVREEVSDKFAAYLFQATSFRRQISAAAKGSNINNLKREHILDHRIALPPLQEQHRIVAKIEELFSELDKGVETFKLARAQLAVYRQALLKHAFEGKLTADWRAAGARQPETGEELLARLREERDARSPGTAWAPPPDWPLPGLPAGWGWIAFGNLCASIRNGISVKPAGDVGERILRISAVRPMKVDLEDFRYIVGDKAAFDSYVLEDGDLLFTRYNGSRKFVGVCGRFKGKLKRLFPDKLIRAKIGIASVLPQFIEATFGCGATRAFIESRIRTTAGQAGISGADIKAVPVPVCSEPEQREIVRILDDALPRIESSEADIDSVAEKADVLRQSILRKAFAGELVPQDPTDEPAAALLERIRVERAHGLPPVKTKSTRTSQAAIA